MMLLLPEDNSRLIKVHEII